jgi:hypothetical protein
VASARSERWLSRLKRWGTAVVAIVGVVATVGGLLASYVGVWWDFHPEDRPDPRSEINADLRFFATERHVGLDDYLHRVKRDPKEYAKLRSDHLSAAGLNPEHPSGVYEKDYLSSPGTVFFVRVTIQGFKGRVVGLRWSIYSAETDRRMSRRSLQNQSAGRILDLASPSSHQVIELWVPEFPGRARYFMRLELVDRDGTSLAIADSDDFASI